jgi:hypothetical protein
MKPQAATSSPPSKRAKPSVVTTTTNKSSKSKDILSDPRLETFMEKARYEAYVDPYRGMFPCFCVSFNQSDNHHHFCNGSVNASVDESSSDSNFSSNDAPFRPGEDVLIGGNHPAKFVSVENDRAIISIELDRISKAEAGKTQSWVSVTANSSNAINHAVRPSEMDIDLEKPSPWMKCSNVLTEQWEYIIPQGVEVVNIDGDEDDKPPKDVLVKTNCPTINNWAQEEWDALQKERTAASKKKKKGRKKKKKEEDDDVVVVDGSGDEMEDDAKRKSEVASDEVICGRRDGDGECACDYNPVCIYSALFSDMYTPC